MMRADHGSFLEPPLYDRQSVAGILGRPFEQERVPVSGGARALPPAREQSAVATRGMGASLTWPGLLRRLDRQLPGYDR